MRLLRLAAVLPVLAVAFVLPLTGCTIFGAALGGAVCDGNRSCVRDFVRVGAHADFAIAQAAAENARERLRNYQCYDKHGLPLQVEARSRRAARSWCDAHGCVCD
ncbi:MAG: hypothetical protein AAF447_22190 [Myxococcota bacterium]